MVTRSIDTRSDKKYKKRDKVKPEDVIDALNLANKVVRWHGTDRKWFSPTIRKKDFVEKTELYEEEF